MPTVPVLDTNQIAPTPISGQPRQAADFGAAGENIGNAVVRLGQQASQAVDAVDTIDAIYDDAGGKRLINQYKAATNDPLYGQGGFYSQQGIRALNAKDGTVKMLTDARDNLVAQAKTPRMKRIVSDGVGALYENDVAGITRHATTQGIQWNVSESQGLQENRKNDAITHADNPALFAANVGGGLSEIDHQAALQGTPPALVRAQKAKWLSGVHVGVADAMARADPVGAAAWIGSHENEMLPSDLTQLKDGLYQPLLERFAVAATDHLLQTNSGNPAIPGTPPAAAAPGQGGSLIARMTPITSFSESRNNPGAVSPKGARGVMQVLPSTAANPGYGIEPSNGSPVDDARVGREKLAVLLKRYGNDPAKAWAAYNWGEGNVDRAVAARGNNWLSGMPAETRAYVGTNLRMLNGAGAPGSFPSIAPRHDDVQSLYTQVDAHSDWTFDQKQAVRREIGQRVSRDDAMVERQQKDARDQAYQAITPMQGNFTSTSQIPRSVWRGLSPEDQNMFTRQAQSNAQPAAVQENGPVAAHLGDMVVSDPVEFIHTDLRTVQDKMTPSEFARYSDKQAKMRVNASGPGFVRDQAVDAVIRQNAPYIGIDLSKPRAGQQPNSTQAEGYAAMQRIRTMAETDLNARFEGQRQPSDADIRAAYDRAVRMVVVNGDTSHPVRAYTLKGTFETANVPDTDRQQITASFRRRYGRNPNEGEIASAYHARAGSGR